MRGKKVFFPILILVGVLFLLSLLRFTGDGGGTVPQTGSEVFGEEQTEMDQYGTHVLADCKGKGDSKSLTGNLMITVILVDDPESAWTKEDLASFKAANAEATEKLKREAMEYGVPLTVGMQYIPCRITDKFDSETDHQWVDEALKAAGFEKRAQVIPNLKKRLGVKEAPVIFAVNRAGRSFAMPGNAKDGFEYAFLYREHGDYRHELYHLFGAEDFYYPESVKSLAAEMLPNSIMVVSGTGVTDPLTAYLIGWTEEPDETAQRFLEATASLTQEDINKALEAGTVTGFATIRYGEGVYTGDLVFGVPNGTGEYCWDDSGNTYQGQWRDGEACGYGVFHWVDTGTTYEGEWLNWKMHGQGTCTYADGTVLSGRFENDVFVG